MMLNTLGLSSDGVVQYVATNTMDKHNNGCKGVQYCTSLLCTSVSYGDVQNCAIHNKYVVDYSMYILYLTSSTVILLGLYFRDG